MPSACSTSCVPMCARPWWLLLLPVLALAQSQTRLSTEAPAWTMTRLHDRLPAQGLERVEVRNLWGDVRLKPSRNGFVQWHAVVQHDGRLQAGPRLQAEVEQGVMRWALAWPDGLDEPGRDRRVDLVLWLPPGPALSLWLEGGRLWMKKPLDNSLRLRSQQADMRILAAGDVDAWSAHGNLTLISRVTPARASRQKLASSTGTVKLVFGLDQDIRIQALTGGDVLADVPAHLSLRPEGRQRILQRGLARHLYELHSDSGDVLLVYRALLEPPP